VTKGICYSEEGWSKPDGGWVETPWAVRRCGWSDFKANTGQRTDKTASSWGHSSLNKL